MTDSKNDPASAPQVSRSTTDSTPTNGVPVASPRKLLRSTMIAAAVAATLLITVVLPAEHGMDPTGVGGLLGLIAGVVQLVTCFDHVWSAAKL